MAVSALDGYRGPDGSDRPRRNDLLLGYGGLSPERIARGARVIAEASGGGRGAPRRRQIVRTDGLTF